MAGAYQTSNFAYQGAGLFAYQGAASAVIPDTATPGRILRIPAFHKVEPEAEKLARRRSYETPVQPKAAPDLSAAYAAKSAMLAKAIQRLNAESEAYRAQIAAFEAQIAAEERAKTRAAIERQLLIAQQALTLAIAQEMAIAEEMEVIDIAFFALLAVTQRH